MGKWRRRFLAMRLEGLADEPGPGAPRKVTDEQVEEVVVKALVLAVDEKVADPGAGPLRAFAADDARHTRAATSRDTTRLLGLDGLVVVAVEDGTDVQSPVVVHLATGDGRTARELACKVLALVS